MSRRIAAEPLTAAAFAPFGDVLEAVGQPDRLINDGRCGRWHDRAGLEVSDGRVGISLFQAEACALPYALALLERHPEGSQTFVPMHRDEWLVTVAPDDGGTPGRPRAFVAGPGQAVNIGRGVWHGVLTPLRGPSLFAVVDRIGGGANLEEWPLDRPWEVFDGRVGGPVG